jgi:D-threo-aldose 1-dehydrogenase
MPERIERHRQKVQLAKAGLTITKLSFGTAPLGGLYTSISEADADDVVAAAFEEGINYFDTAPLYGHGRSETRLGRGLSRAKAPFVLSTKIGEVLNPTVNANTSWFADADRGLEPVFDFSRDGVLRSIDESLERLGVDHIDIVYIHDPDDYVEIALNESYPALHDLRSQGVIKAIGIGMNQSAVPTRFVNETDIDIVLIAGRYTLLDQSAQIDLFPAARRKNVAIVIGGVYNSGVLANPNPGATYDYQPASDEIISRARAVRDVLSEFDVSLTAAALQVPLRHPAVNAVLTGSRNVNELRANIEDFNRDLSDEIWGALEDRGLVVPIG